MLRAKAEEDDAPLPQRDFGERDLARQIFLAEQPTGAQHVFVRVARDRMHTPAAISCHIERGTVDEVSIHVAPEAVRERFPELDWSGVTYGLWSRPCFARIPA